MSSTVLPSALNSHHTQSLFPQPPATRDSGYYTTMRMQCMSNFKLRSEASREEPRLRHLLGHISIYDNVRTITPEDSNKRIAATNNTQSDSILEEETNELSTYLHQVPSFQDFQAAIQDQLATMAKVTASAQQLIVDEYESESDTDSDYDSYDGDWSGDETDESLTDVEVMDSEMSECHSPISELGNNFEHIEDAECWDIKPLTPLLATTVHF